MALVGLAIGAYPPLLIAEGRRDVIFERMDDDRASGRGSPGREDGDGLAAKNKNGQGEADDPRPNQTSITDSQPFLPSGPLSLSGQSRATIVSGARPLFNGQ